MSADPVARSPWDRFFFEPQSTAPMALVRIGWGALMALWALVLTANLLLAPVFERLDFEALLQRIHPAVKRINLLAGQTPDVGKILGWEYRGYNHPKSGVNIYKVVIGERSIVYATDTEGYVGADRRLLMFARGADVPDLAASR